VLIIDDLTSLSRDPGKLTDAIGVRQSLVSQHLRLLRVERLLKQTRSGQNVFYELLDCHVRTMLTIMIDHVLEPQDHTRGIDHEHQYRDGEVRLRRLRLRCQHE
jgi:DNA-binding transcriptional ArsR family regulator